MKTLWFLVIIVALIVAGRFGLNYMLYGRLTPPTTADFEAIARSGQKNVQAISDYRSDHGLLPEKLEDIVPEYLPEKPSSWYYSYGCLTHYCGIPHTMVGYWFVGGESDTWQLRGEGGNERLSVAGPVVKKSSLEAASLFTTRLTEYERRISRHPGEQNVYQDKIAFVGLAKSNGLVVAECERAAKLFPNWWLPPMALAELNETNDEVVQNFKSWVQEHPSFVNYWYLSRLYRDEGDTNSALASLEKASESPFQAYPSDAYWVGAGFAYDAAKFCCENQKYELTLKLVRNCETPEGSGLYT